MTTEQKAKAYDEVVNKLRRFMEQGINPLITRADVQDFFPELQESEGEKIRKSLIALVMWVQSYSASGVTGEDAEAMLNWLEMQGEHQKFANKEYTFKAIPRLLEMIQPTDRAKSYCQKLIDSLEQEGYSADAKIVRDWLKLMNGEKVAMATMDEQKSASEPKFKIGDFPELALSEDERIMKELIHLVKKSNEYGGYALHKDEADRMIAWLERQRNDSYLQEKINAFTSAHKGEDPEEIIAACRGYEKQDDQEPTWSEEDSAALSDALWAIEQARTIAKDENDMGNLWYAERWLMSLKDRVQPQATWKPSDEQMWALSTLANIPESASDTCKKTAKELLEQLKKLRGE